jgi:spore coat protein A, manganese oxidase
VEAPSQVSVKVFDLHGRLVKAVVDEPMQTGTHSLTISGKELSPGIYVCEIQMNNKIYREQIVLTK